MATSVLIVAPQFRELGLSKVIQKAAFELSRKKFPRAKIFGITTSPAVLKINYKLGYRPVVLKQLTDDQHFWSGCSGCVNYDILQRTNYSHCLCTAMLYDPLEKEEKEEAHEKERRISI